MSQRGGRPTNARHEGRRLPPPLVLSSCRTCREAPVGNPAFVVPPARRRFSTGASLRSPQRADGTGEPGQCHCSCSPHPPSRVTRHDPAPGRPCPLHPRPGGADPRAHARPPAGDRRLRRARFDGAPRPRRRGVPEQRDRRHRRPPPARRVRRRSRDGRRLVPRPCHRPCDADARQPPPAPVSRRGPATPATPCSPTGHRPPVLARSPPRITPTIRPKPS